MDFKEKRNLQKSIKEKLGKLETGELSFTEKRALQKEVTADFVKLNEKVEVEPPAEMGIVGPLTPIEGKWVEAEPEPNGILKAVYQKTDSLGNVYTAEVNGTNVRSFWEVKKNGKFVSQSPGEIDYEIAKERSQTLIEAETAATVSPTYDKLKAGDFLDLPAKEFISKLTEAAKELGVEESLTMDIVEPANEWIEKRKEVANESVDQEEIDYVDQFLSGETFESDPDPALESSSETDQDFEDFEIDQETEDQLVEEIKGDYEVSPELAAEGIATEKVKHIKKLWDYAKKIVLRARFDKAPSGDKKKDEEVLTKGDAWGFVQDRYQKLKSGQIKARKPATESTEIEVELEINETEIPGDPLKPEEPPAIESVEEIEDDDEIIIG